MAVLLVLLSVISVSAFLIDGSEHETSIISEVDVGSAPIEVSDDWDQYETVLVDYDELMASANNGTLNITLLGEDININIQQTSENRGKVWYKGYVVGFPEYNVDISIGENEVRGSITTYDMMYNIEPTDVVIDGKTVHLVVAADISDLRLMEKSYPIDPLTFEVINEDNIRHEFAVQVYDPHGNRIFNESYSLQPGNEIHSPEISEVLGRHRYVYTLDNGKPSTLYASVERAAELSSSQKVSFLFVDGPDKMLIGIAQA